jgi:microcystin-dependent protein
MSFFLVNQHSVIPPPGTVVPYIGGGTTANGVNPGDPDGWVICDGQLRTATDNRFTNVYVILNTYMGVISNTANSITPPNLTSRFIYGQTSAATTTTSSDGSASVALIANNIPSLDIAVTATVPDHSHTIPQPLTSNSSPYQPGNVPRVVGNIVQPNNTVSTNKTSLTITASGSYTNNDKENVAILPPYTAMNYIMKY